MPTEAALSPDALARIARLDLRARMVVKGFLQGLHSSPLQGFSVQFSEHQKYNRGDDPARIDWQAYAKTDKYYVKRFEAETNLTGYLAVDLSASMGVRPQSDASGGGGAESGEGMTKFDYSVCLAASLAYLMTLQQDPVGLVTIGETLRARLPPRSRRGHWADVIATLAKMRPAGRTDLDGSLTRLAAMLRGGSLVMIFSDLMPSGDSPDDDPIDTLTRCVARLRHGGSDVIVFHVLDRHEAEFDFEGPIRFTDAETGDEITVDADDYRDAYLAELTDYRESLDASLSRIGADLVSLHTGMPFDVALGEYLVGRASRF